MGIWFSRKAKRATLLTTSESQLKCSAPGKRKEFMRILGRIALFSMMVSVLLFTVQAAHADDDVRIAPLQQRLKAQFVAANIAPNGDILTAGSIMVMQKEGLWLCGLNAGGPLENTYKNGKLSAGRFGWGMALGLMKIDTNTIPQLKFKTGDKFWIKSYNVDKNGVRFFLWSDAIENVRYYGWLKIPFAKGEIPSPDEAMKMISEAVTAEPMDNVAQPAPLAAPPPPDESQAGSVVGQYAMTQEPGNRLQLNADGTLSVVLKGKNYAGTYTVEGNKLTFHGRVRGSATRQGNGTLLEPTGEEWVKQNVAPPALQDPSASMAPVPPPPPPPDAPPAQPKTISLGQTKDEVTAILGQPVKKATLGPKEIYYYSDMKVILVNGKVTDVQ
jgi:hypothetical protein